MKNLKITTEIVYGILKDASWDYEHCGDRITRRYMDEYIAEIESGLSLKVVEDALNSCSDDIEKEYPDEWDINTLAAKYIADAVARQIVDCVYETVTFKIN